jgi:substrate import-associated zinc metallohydrolase lipoprotein
MKRKLNILVCVMALFASMSIISCGDDDNFTESIFDTVDHPLDRTSYTFPLDTFIKVNYQEPYNLRFVYKMEDIGSDLQKNLVPASYDKSVQLAVLAKYLWYDIYAKLGGADFLKGNSPRVIHVIGSKSYNPSQGTETLGTAEGGLKITLYNTNNLDPSNIDVMNQYFFKTMHHEFGHILDQTHLRPVQFNTISNGHYDATGWSSTPDSVSAGSGFVSSYASSATGEDWVEVLANYVTRDSISWANLLGSASYDWEQVDVENLAAYQKLITPGCDMDTIGYFKESQGSDKSKIYRRVCSRNADGSVALVDGKIQWLDKNGIDGRAVILQKLALVRDWLQTYFGVNIDSLRTEVQNHEYVTNADGTFKKDQYGRLINKLTQPLESNPSVTLIESLENEVYQYKSLQK